MPSIFVRSRLLCRDVDAWTVSLSALEPAKRNRGKVGDVKSGTKTLRFKSDGKASIEDVDHTMVKGVERINGLLETYMGINDSDLGRRDGNSSDWFSDVFF